MPLLRSPLLAAALVATVLLAAAPAARATVCVYCNADLSSRLSCTYEETPIDCLFRDEYFSLPDCGTLSPNRWVAVDCPTGTGVCPQVVTLDGQEFYLSVLKPMGFCPDSSDIMIECASPALLGDAPAVYESSCQ